MVIGNFHRHNPLYYHYHDNHNNHNHDNHHNNHDEHHNHHGQNQVKIQPIEKADCWTNCKVDFVLDTVTEKLSLPLRKVQMFALPVFYIACINLDYLLYLYKLGSSSTLKPWTIRSAPSFSRACAETLLNFHWQWKLCVKETDPNCHNDWLPQLCSKL